MSALRDQVESGGQSLLNVHRRIDALVLAAEESADRDRHRDLALELLGHALASLMESEERELLDSILGFLLDQTHEQEAMIRRAADAIRRMSPEAMDAWLREREREKTSQPWITTDRRPFVRRTTTSRDGYEGTVEVVDRDKQIADAIAKRAAQRNKEQP